MAEENKYRIEFNRTDCIGAGACAAANPDHWVLRDDGKPALVDVGGKVVDKGDGKEHEELDFGEKYLEANTDAATVCPVLVIKIKKIETGEIIFP